MTKQKDQKLAKLEKGNRYALEMEKKLAQDIRENKTTRRKAEARDGYIKRLKNNILNDELKVVDEWHQSQTAEQENQDEEIDQQASFVEE